jgi:UDPglucose 6-dehydrogenase
MGDIYRPLSLNQAPMMFTERRTALKFKAVLAFFLATMAAVLGVSLETFL